jgi:hypothetical protein
MKIHERTSKIASFHCGSTPHVEFYGQKECSSTPHVEFYDQKECSSTPHVEFYDQKAASTESCLNEKNLGLHKKIGAAV